MDKTTSDSVYYPYSWHQSHDQATVLIMVPHNTREEDMMVIVEQNYLIAGVQGQPPIIKGRLYGDIDTLTSGWQLETDPAHLSARARTISSTSTTSSTHSSYAFISDPEISSSFAASLESGPVSDAEDFTSLSPALSSPTLSSADEQPFNLRPPRRRLISRPHSNAASSRAVSPGQAVRSMVSSYSSIGSSHASKEGKLVTLHLEKTMSTIWPSLIVGPCPVDTFSTGLSHSSILFDVDETELDKRYEMDPTSLVLVALDLFDIRKDKEAAFEYFLRAWHQAHAPTATMKLATHYLPHHARVDVSKYPTARPVLRGTSLYYLQRLGGPRALAQLYLEAGVLHLDGAATSLMSSSNASLSSLRLPNPAEVAFSNRQTWNRDREAAQKFFDRARVLDLELEVPVLPPFTDTGATPELEMPSIDIPGIVDSVRRRRKKEESSSSSIFSVGQTKVEQDENPWLLYLPGLVGAGTAIVVVGVLGALSFSSWSRRSQSS